LRSKINIEFFLAQTTSVLSWRTRHSLIAGTFTYRSTRYRTDIVHCIVHTAHRYMLALYYSLSIGCRTKLQHPDIGLLYFCSCDILVQGVSEKVTLFIFVITLSDVVRFC